MFHFDHFDHFDIHHTNEFWSHHSRLKTHSYYSCKLSFEGIFFLVTNAVNAFLIAPSMKTESSQRQSCRQIVNTLRGITKNGNLKRRNWTKYVDHLYLTLYLIILEFKDLIYSHWISISLFCHLLDFSVHSYSMEIVLLLTNKLTKKYL